MSLGEMRFYSNALYRQATYSIYVPSGDFEPPYPALLQLHGAGDNHTSWFSLSMLPSFLRSYPFIVVTPSGDISFWTNFLLKGPGTDYEDYVMQDLLPEIERIFPVRKDRWAIGGLSMGGYGAIRLGLLYPDRFASIYAHSSAAFGADKLRERAPEMSDEDVAAAILQPYAERALNHPQRPALTFDCGLDDFLLQENRALHQYLETIGFPHTYLEFPGDHTWEYWNEHVQEALARHADVLNVRPQSLSESAG